MLEEALYRHVELRRPPKHMLLCSSSDKARLASASVIHIPTTTRNPAIEMLCPASEIHPPRCYHLQTRMSSLSLRTRARRKHLPTTFS